MEQFSWKCFLTPQRELRCFTRSPSSLPVCVCICVQSMFMPFLSSDQCPPMSEPRPPEPGTDPPPGAWGTWHWIVRCTGVRLALKCGSATSLHCGLRPALCPGSLLCDLRSDELVQVKHLVQPVAWECVVVTSRFSWDLVMGAVFSPCCESWKVVDFTRLGLC